MITKKKFINIIILLCTSIVGITGNNFNSDIRLNNEDTINCQKKYIYQNENKSSGKSRKAIHVTPIDPLIPVDTHIDSTYSFEYFPLDSLINEVDLKYPDLSYNIRNVDLRRFYETPWRDNSKNMIIYNDYSYFKIKNTVIYSELYGTGFCFEHNAAYADTQLIVSSYESDSLKIYGGKGIFIEGSFVVSGSLRATVGVDCEITNKYKKRRATPVLLANHGNGSSFDSSGMYELYIQTSVFSRIDIVTNLSGNIIGGYVEKNVCFSGLDYVVARTV